MLLAHGTVSDNQNVLHRHIQQDAQGVEVIDGRQAHAALPAVNGLRRFKPEIGLKVADGQTPFLPKTKDVRAGCAQVDDREGMLLHHVRLLHIRL